MYKNDGSVQGELYEEAIHNYNKIMPHYERIVVDYRAMARITVTCLPVIRCQ